jgi:hypothetical protein
VDNAEGEGEGEEKEEEQWLMVGTTKTGGELREMLSTVLCFCSSSSNSG